MFLPKRFFDLVSYMYVEVVVDYFLEFVFYIFRSELCPDLGNKTMHMLFSDD